ncbi:DUF2937 family protein [Roseomonas haemaphysalidis]|uniref:DUF2937 family protein n=1 Tax=Roseomonas haemaphysalidis TaxID=2768162 RepID=A0ABS3KQB8_9PROT|nr:DUF2937 family protein [Roseomonas haemaphysalidis]MBO1078546.1 DUF2937 family protein [Roseomonas haemaphysalidis]
MRRFLGRWLSDFLRLGLGLGLAIGAMQLPALAASYGTALLQVAEGARRDIDQRKQVAGQFYRWDGTLTDGAAIDALRGPEPANAEGLAGSVRREQQLREAEARLRARPALLRPVQAAWDWPSGGDEVRAVLRLALDTHVPQVVLSLAGATYGLAGLLLGLLVANLLVAVGGRERVPPPPRPGRSVADRRTPSLRA